MEVTKFVIQFVNRSFVTPRCRYWSLETTDNLSKARFYTKECHAKRSIEASVPTEFRDKCVVRKLTGVLNLV